MVLHSGYASNPIDLYGMLCSSWCVIVSVLWLSVQPAGFTASTGGCKGAQGHTHCLTPHSHLTLDCQTWVQVHCQIHQPFYFLPSYPDPCSYPTPYPYPNPSNQRFTSAYPHQRPSRNHGPLSTAFSNTNAHAKLILHFTLRDL